MSTRLIAVGTGIIGCLGTVALACRPGSDLRHLPRIVAVTSVATAAIGLLVAKLCKGENQTLNKKDAALIGGAGVVGSLLGGAVVVTVFTIFMHVMIKAMGVLWMHPLPE